MRLILSLFFLFIGFSAQAESKGSMELKAFVPLTVKTSISQFNVSNREALLILSNQVNSEFSQETQKVEVEGMNKAGLEAHLKKIVSNDRTIQYHLLINRLKSTAVNDQPIFLKISAN